MNPGTGKLKEAEPSDPLELVGTEVPGEVRYLARCLIEEYAQLGYTADELLLLFNQPSYNLMNRVLTSQGEPWVRELINEVLAECGTAQVQTREKSVAFI